MLKMARPKNKYGAKRTSFDGLSFASKAEARRYAELTILQRAGQIADLKCQPRFPLKVEGVLVATYVADFSYTRPGSAALVVEDVKSHATRTPVYRLKAKLLKALHGIEVTEIMHG